MEFRWDYDNDEPVLLLDGIIYDDLPFLSPDFKLNEQQVSEYRSTLRLNKNVRLTNHDEPVEWEQHNLAHQVQDKLCGDDLTDIEIENLNHETSVTNELLDMLANFNMPVNGLSSISFKRWIGGMQKAIDMAVIERLAHKSTNLRELTLA